MKQEVKMTIDVSDDQLGELKDLLEQHKSHTTVVDAMSEELSLQKQKLKELSEVSIPEKMKELGLKEFVTHDGDKVSINSFYTAYIPTLKACAKDPELATRRENAMRWLEDNGHGTLIKNEVSVKFDKSDHAKSKELYDELLKKGLVVSMNESVNPRSLQSTINDLKSNDVQVDDELFKVFYKNETKIKKGTFNE